jgi:hypothetical protein
MLAWGGSVRAAEEKPVVTEITLVRTQGLGTGPKDRLVLRADGTAEYEGLARVEKRGRFRGSIPKPEFTRLTRLLEEKFFDLEPTYRAKGPGGRGFVTDAPGVVLTVIRDGKSKSVADYGRGGPAELREAQAAILDVLKTISWQKADPDSK